MSCRVESNMLALTLAGILTCALAARGGVVTPAAESYQAGASSPERRDSISGTLAALAKHLRAKEYEIVMRDFTQPDVLKKMMLRTGNLEALAREAQKRGNFDRMLDSVLASQKVEPQLFEGGNFAVFTYTQAGEEKTFALRRIGMRWFLI